MNRTSSFPPGIKRRKIIKKYGNRKLYDTERSSYVVLKDIEKMIRNQEEIQVIDNETENDITIPTLTQIIFSSEKKTKVAPPVNILKSIIRDGDGSFSSFLSKIGLFETSQPSSRAVFGKKKQGFLPRQGLERRAGFQTGKSKASLNDNIPELPGSHLT